MKERPEREARPNKVKHFLVLLGRVLFCVWLWFAFAEQFGPLVKKWMGVNLPLWLVLVLATFLTWFIAASNGWLGMGRKRTRSLYNLTGRNR